MTELQKFLKEAKGEIVALGKEHGYDFTEEQVTALAEGQLSEDQLDSVSGGMAIIGNLR